MLAWLEDSSSILDTACNPYAGLTKGTPKETILPKKIISNPYHTVVALKNQRDVVLTPISDKMSSSNFRWQEHELDLADQTMAEMDSISTCSID